jgi:16S rRNA (adenine1518-N6/adenine1519-N6)-dimethyltransferase
MIRARKRFGQHFLEPAWVDKVLRAIDPRPDQIFIEIGPGQGALTRPLAARARRVVAYEIDRDLAADLGAAAIGNLTIVAGDFLAASPITDIAPDAGTTLRVAGNLPYNIASPILFALADAYSGGLPIVDATVMLQREVANRLVSPPGGREYGVLSVLIQHVATPSLLLKLPAGAFRPVPKVESALVKLTFHPPDPHVDDPARFAAFVQAVFTRRRKTLANALRATADPAKAARALESAGLDGNRRPETLTVAEFARLANAL